MMGRSSAAVTKIIRSIDPNLRWSLAWQELKRCISDEKSIAHSAFKLNTLVQKPNENIHMYIIKYSNLHQRITGKRPEQETDQSHLTKFLISINKCGNIKRNMQMRYTTGYYLTRPLFDSN